MWRATTDTEITFFTGQQFCMCSCRKWICEGERKLNNSRQAERGGVSQETIPGRCPCGPRTWGLSLRRFSWQGLLATIWEGLPELLITNGKPWVSSLALRQMYAFGLKFRGSKAEIADGNPKQGDCALESCYINSIVQDWLKKSQIKASSQNLI